MTKPLLPRIRYLISGGQRGADRAALGAGKLHGVPLGGWAPKGYRAEDAMPDWCREVLHETETADYVERTRLNVEHSDATLVFAGDGGEMTPGSRLTLQIAAELNRAHYHVSLRAAQANPQQAVDLICVWLGTIRSHGIEEITLNVAGVRESKWPGVEAQVAALVLELLKRTNP